MSKISVIILAAGLGTRMKSNKAKVAHKICGLSMIEHVLNKAYEISDDVGVVLYHQKQSIEEIILKAYPKTKIFTQDLQNFPGTAGALKNINFSGEKVLVTCGDMPLVSTDELKSLCLNDADITMSSFVADDPFGYGRVLEKDGKVVDIIEQKDADETQKLIKRVNAGCYCFKTESLNKILPQISNKNKQNEYYLTDSIKIANQMGLKCVAVDVCEQNFMGINDKFQLSIAENLIQEKIKKDLMKQGVLMRLASSIYIDVRAKFEGECEIEENVSIIGKCVIKNSIIKSSSVIEDSIIEDSDIGPLAHIRPNSQILKTHIGNFVEVKKGVLNGVKAGHLSYLGDCEIDSGTNIGCGTITCNYDGKAKYKTKIGKNVFVGSDSQLVAPVNVGDDVLIAAGSTITNDIPSGSLAIARSKQSNKADFFYKFFGKNDVKK
ncbi:MAG: bifunctional UDP-N-acetylglucosamine diphosphorylase/glucosamine-1-phosphate N-acetyltransferase GlmU [Campylobacter sp.]|nr:bifunctional UDP-N-acetylglucosamine diphosphorylase/glucosamine-1-phosphate N-acetyltransferase GlmU [Campylobacter sp.]